MESTSRTRGSALDPVSRISEILFGLVMVLTFTSSMRAADIIRDDVREMLWGAIGCNIAWGVIDAFMYLMSVTAERGREGVLLRQIASERESKGCAELVRELLPDAVGERLSESQLAGFGAELRSSGQPINDGGLTLADLRGALAVFTLVFVVIFPVTIPFIFMSDVWSALRVSNMIALVLFYLLGSRLAQYSGKNPVLNGVRMTAIGVALVGIANALGG